MDNAGDFLHNPCMIAVRYAGVNTRALSGSEDLTIDCPDGFGAWVFMLFTTGFEVRTPGGIELGGPGDVLVNDPRFPQWHRGNGSRFHNHWLHLSDSEGEIGEAVRSYGVPTNRPFSLVATAPVLNCLEDIQREFLLRQRYWEQEADSLVRRLLRLCGRLRAEAHEKVAADEDWLRFSQFSELRLAMRADVSRRWTVDEMAGSMHLSPSRFGVLYRKFFDVSPIEDVIVARLEHSRALLLRDNMTVGQVAEESGFSTIYYFCRVFKRRMGCSPMQYRRLAGETRTR